MIDNRATVASRGDILVFQKGLLPSNVKPPWDPETTVWGVAYSLNPSDCLRLNVKMEDRTVSVLVCKETSRSMVQVQVSRGSVWMVTDSCLPCRVAPEGVNPTYTIGNFVKLVGYHLEDQTSHILIRPSVLERLSRTGVVKTLPHGNTYPTWDQPQNT